MIIRPAQIADYADYCDLMAQIDKLHRDQHPEYFREAIPVRERFYYESVLADENQTIWVAEIDGKLAGIIEWEVIHARDIPILQSRTAIRIDTLVVHQDYKRQGIGRALMSALDEWAKAQNILNLELGVWTFNESAIKFYESLGYSFYRTNMHRKLDDS